MKTSKILRKNFKNCEREKKREFKIKAKTNWKSKQN